MTVSVINLPTLVLLLLLLFTMTSLLLVEIVASSPSDVAVVVDSPFGRIRGLERTDNETGLTYVSFKGIPYAKAPVDDLRFAKPQPHPNIEGVFDATKDEVIACHPPFVTTSTTYTEDCLVLNIRLKTTQQPGGGLRKVLVYIHGGAFTQGNSYVYDPTSFVNSQDIIFVTINYRLGVLGFLSTEDAASPGNYGLWDQTLALVWVKDNIRAFGGDPDDITIYGLSAGGSSVGYQVISPHNKGLFTKAYIQSATATAVYARSINAKSHALKVAKSAGCWYNDSDIDLSTNQSTAVIDCLRKAPVSSVIVFTASVSETQFVPRVDGDFVPDVPTVLLSDDTYLDSIGFFQRSYLIAIDNDEIGIIHDYLRLTKAFIFSNISGIPPQHQEYAWQDQMTAIKNRYMLSRLGEKVASDGKTVKAINDFYNRRFLPENSVAEMVSDLSTLIPSFDFLSAAARRKSCNSYFLYFDHFPQYMKKSSGRGTYHGLDLLYLFDTDLQFMEKLLGISIDGNITEEDVKLKTLFSSVIGEFARTGNPGLALKEHISCDWPKYDVCKGHYLNFNPKPWVGSFLMKDKHDFWLQTVPDMASGQLRAVCGESCPASFATQTTLQNPLIVGLFFFAWTGF